MRELELLVPTLFGLEGLCAEGLRRLKLPEVTAKDGRVRRKAAPADIPRVNLSLRTDEQVLLVMGRYQAADFEALFEGCCALPWEEFIPREGAFSVKGRSLNSQFHAVPARQAVLKKTATTQLGGRYGLGTLPESEALYQIQFSIMRSEVTLMLDTTGVGLHKQGCRAVGVAAPLREALTAVMVLLSRYRGRDPFCDSLCGLGTIAIGAALIAKNRVPDLNRVFSAQKWCWLGNGLQLQAAGETIDGEYGRAYDIWDGDIDPRAVAIARANAERADVEDVVHFEVTNAAAFHRGTPYGQVVTDPPYRECILEKRKVEELYRTFGRAVCTLPEGWRVSVLPSHTEFERIFGRAADKKRKLYNGMLKYGLFQYGRQEGGIDMRQGEKRRTLAGLPAATLYAGLFFLPTSAAPEGVAVQGYSKRLAQCELAGKWGYMGTGRNVAIPLQYNNIVSFQLSIATVNLNDKLGVVRQNGRYLIQPEYDTLLPTDCELYITQKRGGWGVVSIPPFPDGAGSTINVFYELNYDQVRVAEQGGTQVLALTKGSTVTEIPVYDLPGILTTKGVPSTQFPLTRGKLPSFSDVSPRDWFALWVGIAYNVGLTSSVGKNRYVPNQTSITAKALKLAVTIESRYQRNDFHLSTEDGSYWCVPTIDYCLASGMIQKGDFTERGYGRTITRREAAELFAATNLAKAVPELSSLARVEASVPDARNGNGGAETIYSLYAKEILSGVDSRLTFQPEGTFARAETTAIVSRMARTEQHLFLWS